MKILSYLIIGIVIILILSKITKGKLIFTKEEKSKKRDYIVKTLLSLGFIIGLVFIFFSTWFVEFFGQITPEQFLFNLKAPLKGTGSGMTGEILKSPVLNIVICAIPFLIFVNLNNILSKWTERKKKKKRPL